MAFETARSMPGSQQDSYQGSTIWFCRKATLRNKISESLYRQSSSFKGSSLPTTKTTKKKQQQYPSPLIQLHRWLSSLFHQWRGPRRLQQKNVVDLLRPPLPPSKQKRLRLLSCLIFSGFTPPSPARLGGFSPNTLRIFRFSSSVSHWVRRFFINQSRIFFIVPLGLRT